MNSVQNSHDDAYNILNYNDKVEIVCISCVGLPCSGLQWE